MGINIVSCPQCSDKTGAAAKNKQDLNGVRERAGGEAAAGGAERRRHNGTPEDEWEREGRRKGGARAAVIDKTDWRSSPLLFNVKPK